MFRSRKSSTATELHTSSLSSGNASIQRPSAVVETIDYTNSHYEEEYHPDEIIDLQASEAELTIESMSAVIAAAVQMSAQGGTKSSLSLGSASILQPFSKTEQTDVKRRFSTRLFSSWSSKKPTSPTNTAPTTPALEPSSPFSDSTVDDDMSQSSPRSSSVSEKMDDGRDELAYRGIQIKEIKTTLKTLVISDEVRYPMPEVKLERPGFARINY